MDASDADIQEVLRGSKSSEKQVLAGLDMNIMISCAGVSVESKQPGDRLCLPVHSVPLLPLSSWHSR